MSISIGVFGASGRMGKMVIREIMDDPEVVLAGGTVREGSPVMDRSLADIAGLPADVVMPQAVMTTISPEKLLGVCDVAVDFTRPEASVHHAYVAAAMGKAIVIGTSGFAPDQLQMIADAANHIPIVLSYNMSLGGTLLQGLVEIAAQALDARYDIEILDMHHKHKVDAPSGTALALGEAAAAGRQVALKTRAVFDRKGKSGPRRRGDIGFAVLRGGDVVGDHTVFFAADGERVELSHKASDRRIFASGAVHAAKWLVQQPPGRYSMKDVLGF